MHETLQRWHEFVARRDAAILDEILADDVRFHSPFVWKPKEGKQMTRAILLTVTRQPTHSPPTCDQSSHRRLFPVPAGGKR